MQAFPQLDDLCLRLFGFCFQDDMPSKPNEGGALPTCGKLFDRNKVHSYSDIVRAAQFFSH